MRKFLFFLWGISLILLCGKKEENQKIDVNKGVYKESGEVARLEYIREIKLDESQYKFGRINLRTVDQNGNIFVFEANNKCYYRFNKDGEFWGLVGRKGYGPGEYVQGKSLCVDGINMKYYIYDKINRKIVVYNENNECILEKKIYSSHEWIYITNHMGMKLNTNNLMMSSIVYDKDSFWNLKAFHIYDTELNYEKTLKVLFPDIYPKFDRQRLGINSVFDDSNIYYTLSIMPYLYKMDLEGNLIGVYGNIPENFQILNKNCTESRRNIKEHLKLLVKFSETHTNISIFNNKYVIYCYYNHKTDIPENKLDINNFEKVKVVTYPLLFNTEGESIKVDFSDDLNNGFITTPDGLLYTLANDEPDNRMIKVYKIIIEKEKE